MDWTTIIVALISALSCGGLTALITLREKKKGHQLDNKQKEADLEDKKKDDVIEDWKQLAEQRKVDLLEERQHMEEMRTRCDERDVIIADLRAKLDSTRTRCAIAEILRCRRADCTERIPKLGTRDIDVAGIMTGLDDETQVKTVFD